METDMKIAQRNIDEIKPYEGNPRLNDRAVDAVGASLGELAVGMRRREGPRLTETLSVV